MGIKPYITPKGAVVFPSGMDAKYRWWDGGQSAEETLREIGAPRELIEAFKEKETVHDVGSNSSDLFGSVSGQ